MQDSVVGVDLGGTLTKFGLVSRNGDLLAYNSIPTDSTITYQDFFKRLYDQVWQLKDTVDSAVNLKGIGFGAPTGNYCTGNIENASNLEWSGTIPVVNELKKHADLPTVLINDANASAFGEKLYGAARGMDNFISITLGTGLGCGIVANGKLVAGQNGHAGEIGHTTVYYDGRPCSCGRRGCLETYVSAPGLVKTVQGLLEDEDIESALPEAESSRLNARMITQEARSNDELACKAFQFTGKILGLKLADIVATMNPEAIIISGGLAKAGSLILDPAKKSMEDHLLTTFKNEVEIIPSSLTEKNAAILGAAATIWKELESEKKTQKYETTRA